MIMCIAMPLPSATASNTARSASQLSYNMTGGLLTPSDGYNICLQHLGQVSSDKLIYLYSILDGIRTQQLTLSYSSIVSWRSSVVAKIKPNAELSQLQSTLADSLELLGMPVERRAYRPHVSIASGAKFQLPFSEVSKTVSVYNMPFVCNRVVLYEVQFVCGVASYHEVYSVSLLAE